MPTTASTRRATVRWVHIIVGLALGTFVYLPSQYEDARDVLQLGLAIVGVPLIVVTGVWMWKGAAIRRSVRRRRHDPALPR